jgi:hypothetical protein
VKLGINKKTGEQVAIKSISKAKLVCKEDVKDVQAEVAIMNLVAGHANVVSLKVGDISATSKPQLPNCRPILMPCQHPALATTAAVCRALLKTRRQCTFVWSSAREASCLIALWSQATSARKRQRRWAAWQRHQTKLANEISASSLHPLLLQLLAPPHPYRFSARW